MLYADIGEHKQQGARPGLRAACPVCHGEVIPKCGELVCWHWAHVASEDCDHWSEGETRWHRRWKENFPLRQREVTIARDGECHRADAVRSCGLVIELQHSAISPEEIREREDFYGRMIWIFDVREAVESERLEIRTKRRSAGDVETALRIPSGIYSTFRWKHPRKSISVATSPVFLDTGEATMFCLRRMYTDSPCGGWGAAIPFTGFLDWLVAPLGEDERAAAATRFWLDGYSERQAFELSSSLKDQP